MRSGSLSGAVFAALLVGAESLAPAQAETLPAPRASYTAEQTITAQGQTLRQTIYHDRGKERREIEFEGERSTVLLRPDRACAYTIADGPTTQMTDLDEAGPVPMLATLQRFNAAPEAQETLHGEPVTRYAIRGPGADGEPVEGRVWVTPDGILMKSEMLLTSEEAPAPVIVELEKLERKALPPSLFDPPADRPVADMRGETERTRPMSGGEAR
jgi:hypothetical protein